MEYGWERTYPFLEVDSDKINILFKGILKEESISDITEINEGCRTTNYIVKSREQNKKYILKIFLSTEQEHKKEIKLLTMLADNKIVPVPEIYKFSSNEIVKGNEYLIYQYLEGKTIGQAINEGYMLEESFIKQVARSLAQIHRYKFNKAGFLDENLNIYEEVPPLNLWYKNIIGNRIKERLGQNVVDKINDTVRKYEKILVELDEDIRLVHGDFQGTNILIRDGKLAGILDWEFAAAGHPLSDIGQFFRYEEYFNKNLLIIFEKEYDKYSSYKLIDDWYRISKLRDLINLIQLLGTEEYMPKKHSNIKNIIVKNLEQF